MNIARSAFSQHAALLATLLTAGPVAHAQIIDEPAGIYPDPRKFVRGAYAEAEVGSLLWLGSVGDDVGPGVSVGARLGFDLGRFFAIGAFAAGSTHTTGAAGRPQDGQLLQIFQGGGELKLKLPIGAFNLFACGRAGYAKFSTNILGALGYQGQEIDATASPLFGGGGGFDYHTQSRHFAYGLQGQFSKLVALSTTGTLGVSAFARYTF